MTEGDSDAQFQSDEQLLEKFRVWLRETRQDAALSETVPGDAGEIPELPPEPRVGLDRLIAEFTAVRQELKLQTRSSRALEERLEASLATLGDAANTFRTAAAAASDTSLADKAFATAIAELDEALDRGREQWERSTDRMIGGGSPDLRSRLDEIQAKQPWWRRPFTARCHRQVCALLEETFERAQLDQQAQFAALLGGYALIQQRLTRILTRIGVARIVTVGRPVDPDLMVVVEVVDAEGPAGQVVEEIRRGYTWRGQLLRTAEVRAIRPRF